MNTSQHQAHEQGLNVGESVRSFSENVLDR